MSTTVLAIYNLALQKLGAARLAIGEESRNSRSCDACYEILRDTELRSRAWKFAIRRASLTASAATPVALVDTGFASAAAYILPADCLRVLFPPRTFNDWVIETVDLTSVLTGSINPTASTAVVGVSTLFTTELIVGDSITVTGETRIVTAITDATNLTVDVAFTDGANDTSPDKIAGRFPAIITNDGAPLGIRYIARVTNPANFDPSFVEMLACRMGSHMCEEITQSNTKQANINAQYMELRNIARQMNAFETIPADAPEDSWSVSRRTGSGQAPWLSRQNG